MENCHLDEPMRFEDEREAAEPAACSVCAEPLDEDWHGLCQMCWENECAKSWWVMAQALPTVPLVDTEEQEACPV